MRPGGPSIGMFNFNASFELIVRTVRTSVRYRKPWVRDILGSDLWVTDRLGTFLGSDLWVNAGFNVSYTPGTLDLFQQRDFTIFKLVLACAIH